MSVDECIPLCVIAFCEKSWLISGCVFVVFCWSFASVLLVHLDCFWFLAFLLVFGRCRFLVYYDWCLQLAAAAVGVVVVSFFFVLFTKEKMCAYESPEHALP